MSREYHYVMTVQAYVPGQGTGAWTRSETLMVPEGVTRSEAFDRVYADVLRDLPSGVVSPVVLHWSLEPNAL